MSMAAVSGEGGCSDGGGDGGGGSGVDGRFGSGGDAGRWRGLEVAMSTAMVEVAKVEAMMFHYRGAWVVFDSRCWDERLVLQALVTDFDD